MARDAEGRTRRERKELRQQQRQAERASAPRSRTVVKSASASEEVVVSRSRRAAHFRVQVGAVSLDITHVQAWDLAQSLLAGLCEVHLGRVVADHDVAEDEDEDEGAEDG